MNTARENLLQWTDCLLDPHAAAGQHREAAHEWCRWTLALLGVNENEASTHSNAFFSNSMLATGKAISPLGALRCLRDFRRTAVFLQGMDAALRTALERFPGETIHVLEAGCGPIAPLALPFALRYSADQAQFNLLDFHPTSMEAARRMVSELGIDRSIRAFVVGDATSYIVEERPHIIACEMLRHALTSEPQVAATLNLAPQLRERGIFLPERVDVDAVLLDLKARARALMGNSADPTCHIELGNVFSLDASAVENQRQDSDKRLRANLVSVPPHDPMKTPLHLFTRVRVFREHTIREFESGITQAERIKHPATLAETGGPAAFFYQMGASPGFHLGNSR